VVSDCERGQGGHTRKSDRAAGAVVGFREGHGLFLRVRMG
jgi:hypothetical protein